MVIVANSHYLTYTFLFERLGGRTFLTWEWKGEEVGGMYVFNLGVNNRAPDVCLIVCLFDCLSVCLSVCLFNFTESKWAWRLWEVSCTRSGGVITGRDSIRWRDTTPLGRSGWTCARWVRRVVVAAWPSWTVLFTSWAATMALRISAPSKGESRLKTCHSNYTSPSPSPQRDICDSVACCTCCAFTLLIYIPPNSGGNK